MPDAPDDIPAAPAALRYATTPAGVRARLLRHLRPGTPGFFLLTALLIATAAWGGWKLMLSRDRKAFEACATRYGASVIEFTHLPSRGALRHLAHLPGGPWAISLEWPAAEGAGVPAGLGAADVTELAVIPGIDADALLTELSRPGSAPKALARLSLSGSDVTDAGLAALARPDAAVNALTALSLNDTHVTDTGLAALARPDSALKALTALELDHTPVTDTGLTALARPDSGLKGLAIIDLYGAHVTDAGVEALQRARPSLRIIH